MPSSGQHPFPSRSPSLEARALNAALWFLMRRRQEKEAGTPLTASRLRQAAADASRQTARNRRVPRFVRVETIDLDGVPAERVTAGVPDTARTVLYFHGGAFFMCSPATHRPITWRLARAGGCRVIVPEYRKAPDHAFPAWLDDGVHAWRALLAQGARPQDVVFAGDSAGGNLLLGVLQRARAEGLPMPAAAVLLSPWADLTCSGESMERNRRRDPMFATLGVRALAEYLCRGNDPRDPLLSPLFADFRGFPPLLVHACSTELIRDDARRLVARARAEGVSVEYKEWHRLPHVFHLFAGLIPESSRAIRQVGDWIRRR